VQATDQGDGLWTLTGSLPAGDYEFKAAINGAWDENYGLDGEAGGANIPAGAGRRRRSDLPLRPRHQRGVGDGGRRRSWPAAEPSATTPEAAEPVAPESVSFPGTIGAALGGADWAPDDAAVQATGEGLGVWSLVAELPAGDYEFKAALNGAWDENYGLDGEPGGANIPLSLAADAEVTFRYDAATHAVWAEVMGEVVAGATPAE
jgi:hypothetical protein